MFEQHILILDKNNPSKYKMEIKILNPDLIYYEKKGKPNLLDTVKK